MLGQDALAAPTPVAASEAFFRSLQPFGATYIQTRAYRRPRARLTSDSHWSAGGFILRYAPDGWVDSVAFDYVCFENNPLLDAIRLGQTCYRFSDFAPRNRRFGRYWEALAEARIHDALCATSYGAAGAIASLHLGFGDGGLGPDEARAIQMAGLLLTERLIGFGLPDAPEGPRLTPRERDALAFVAEGKTDWEIATILGLSESTARFHVDNARRKLGAVNRSHAVARLITERLL
ncbi:helix-turn-helix transcriptional regulator [Glacieibacterium frigidum]|uniref:HTH luxR-type domain-containing protein n=1 Tax=Glacieibacterium frigidum TaxID=2593303 RepID=A0A552UI54_9SPHN|nr:helix-turn-helix transcriptional regulator [Glacieibacterium frigidum]TRW17909.1 hypothetical protein FMM06_07215 [Glacieibacterium frigidum]